MTSKTFCAFADNCSRRTQFCMTGLAQRDHGTLKHLYGRSRT